MASASTLCFKYLVSFQQLINPLTTKLMTLMQTLLLGHVPVLSQMTGVHTGFLMMKRSASEHVYVEKQIIFVGSSKNFH